MRCPECGHTSVPGSKFCNQCGAPVRDTARDPAPPSGTASAGSPAEVHALLDGGSAGCEEGLATMVRESLASLVPGQVLEIRSTNPGVREDLPAWCRASGHEYLGSKGTRYFVRKRGLPVGSTLKWGLVGIVSAVAGSACYLLPLALVLLGLSGSGLTLFGLTYRWVLLPAGVVGLAASYTLYLRERRRCAVPGLGMAGGRAGLALLLLATLLLLVELAIVVHPGPVERLLAGASPEAGTGSGASVTGASGGDRR